MKITPEDCAGAWGENVNPFTGVVAVVGFIGALLAISITFATLLTGCVHPKPPEPTLVAKLGWGGGDPFVTIWDDGVTVKMKKILAAAKELSFTNTQMRVMLSHKFKDKDGKWWGQKFCPYKKFNDVSSGLNQPFFNKVRWFCVECNKIGVVPVLEIIDGNWIHLDPFATKRGIKGAYFTTLKAEQKQYINKLIKTVDGLAVIFIVSNERYIGTSLTSVEGEAEEILRKLRMVNVLRAVPLVPTKIWMQNAVNYVKAKSGRKVGVWHEYGSVTNKDFIVVHSGWGTAAKGRVCNEEAVEGLWGGDASVQGYKDCAQRCHERKVFYQFAFWEWAMFNDKFAPRQMKAMRWAKSQGWF